MTKIQNYWAFDIGIFGIISDFGIRVYPA